MSGPFKVAAGFAAAAALLLGVLAWLTGEALRLEREREVARAEAWVEEKVRLALWRLESAVAPLLAVETLEFSKTTTTARLQSKGNLGAKAGKSAKAPGPEVENAEEEADDPGAIDILRFVNCRFVASREGTALEVPRRKDEPTASTPDQSAETECRDALETLLCEPISRLRDREATPAPQVLEEDRAPSQAQERVGAELQQVAAQVPAQVSSPSAAQIVPSQQVQNFAQFEQQRLNSNEWQARNESNRLLRVEPEGQASRVPRRGLEEGERRPVGAVWIAGELLLLRQVGNAEARRIEGSWLDWPALRADLLSRVADLLPSADLLEAKGDAEGFESRRLAALPIRLEPGPLPPPPYSKEGAITISLVAAWACVILAIGAVAALLAGTVRLSERRGAFVSAVTHELRTPLTTFRMYTEMLTGGMVDDPAKRKLYLDTLAIEARRLEHLVENVLTYAKVERGCRPRAAALVTVGELIDRVLPRLEERAREAARSLEVRGDPEALALEVRADAGAVEQILFNLVDNAVKHAVPAKDPTIRLEVRSSSRGVELRVGDRGPGIPAAFLGKLFRPFSRSASEAAGAAPGVGLGLALSRRLAREMGGDLQFEEAPEPGATFVLSLPGRHGR